ncbi:hypothetical protein HA402_006173 [Bradysia odoriphaga]|nr:hypothetical protein HA402_006173 [Bradysia odoriphaga]
MSFPEYIVKIVDNIAKQEHFIDYRIESSDATKRGENFTGKLSFLQLTGTRNIVGNDTSDNIRLVLKTVPSNRNQRQVFQAVTGFKCEVEMYTKVLPKFVSFQDEKRITTDQKLLDFPNVYTTVFDEDNNQFAIVMEDLRAKNYKKLSRSNNMTYDHARLVMAKLAQFHAISFAMKDQNLDAFDEIVRSETLSSKFMKDDLGYEISNIFDRASNVLENAKHKELIDDLKTTYLEWVDKFSSKQFVGESGVLLHGDCQTNNVLFQHNDDDENPIDAMLIDWQMSRFGPPIIDLLYFILSTTDKSFRDQHFRNLLNEYHNLLSTNIEQLGSDASKVYPKSTFDSDLIKFNRFALIFACVSATFRLTDERHILDLEEYAERICKGERPKLILEFDAETETLYRKALNDIVADVVQYCGIN